MQENYIVMENLSSPIPQVTPIPQFLFTQSCPISSRISSVGQSVGQVAGLYGANVP